MTLFGLYRVLHFPGKVSVKTITDPRENLVPLHLREKAGWFDRRSYRAGPFLRFIGTFYTEMRKMMGLTKPMNNSFLVAALQNLGSSPQDATDFFKSQLKVRFFAIEKSSPTTVSEDKEISTSLPALRRAA